MDCFIHQTYGRMRVRVNLLKGDQTRSRELVRVLAALDGVVRVVANDITGSIVVNYNPERLGSAAILRVFQEHKLLANIIGFPLAPVRQRRLYQAGHQEFETWITDTVDIATRMILKSLLEAVLQKTGKILLNKILP